MTKKNSLEKNIKLIIGLGNPGREYENTYHNAGFLFVDYLEKKLLPTTRYLLPTKLLKSGVYMNESGVFVKKAISAKGARPPVGQGFASGGKNGGIRPEELLIVHDDSDLCMGKFKLHFGRGAAGHKGVESVIKSIRTKNFWRLRLGIRKPGTRHQIPDTRLKAGEFVLKKITPPDKKILEATFREAAGLLSPLSMGPITAVG